MRSLCFLLVLLAGIFQLVSAQGSNAITIPPDGFNVTAGQPTTISWTNPSLRTVTIQLVPASGSGAIITLVSMLENTGTATFDIPSDVPTTQQYQFKILDDSNSSNVNFSPSFNIAPPPPGSYSTSTAAASTAAASTAAPTSSNSSTSPSNNSLSAGAIAGISVGLALGILVLVGIVIFFIRRRRKHRTWMQEHQQKPPAPNEHAPAYDMNNQYDPMHPLPQPPPQPPPTEVSGSRSWPREMEAGSRFQPREVVELPTPATDADPATRKYTIHTKQGIHEMGSDCI
ncbi:hypothetical protein GJ744_007304 [Endocarpon pusillum]|uniref:Yeast cell wall synthesis Kre9/Knh1-like N-terminal domain-containing protein n=1 Tax=Endocarpon pusillum TaxID=364733 RepID=A0A8H7ART9_9EURO|nr:hypothetical protein GJ744_007304 [Endocarpon pusillum]